MDTKLRTAWLLPCLLALGAQAGERIPQGLNAMPAADIERLNRGFSAPSDRYDTPPRLEIAYTPIYPASRLRARQTGQCKVSFLIGTDGVPRNPKADPAADPKMCAHALYALGHWRFTPARKAGEPVEAGFSAPFDYALR